MDQLCSGQVLFTLAALFIVQLSGNSVITNLNFHEETHVTINIKKLVIRLGSDEEDYDERPRTLPPVPTMETPNNPKRTPDQNPDFPSNPSQPPHSPPVSQKGTPNQPTRTADQKPDIPSNPGQPPYPPPASQKGTPNQPQRTTHQKPDIPSNPSQSPDSPPQAPQEEPHSNPSEPIHIKNVTVDIDIGKVFTLIETNEGALNVWASNVKAADEQQLSDIKKSIKNGTTAVARNVQAKVFEDQGQQYVQIEALFEQRKIPWKILEEAMVWDHED